MRNDSNIVSFEDAKRSVRGRFVSNTDESKTASISAAASIGERRERPRGASKGAIPSEANDASSASNRSAPRDETSELSLKEAKRRARNKAKADRAFDKMYGGDQAGSSKRKGIIGKLSRKGDSAASDDSAGPRAAVYKGEMGAKHRKAAAMQSGRAGGRFSLSLPFGFGRPKHESPASDERGLDGNFPAPRAGIGHFGRIALRTGVIALCLVVFFTAIYAPAQQCYVQIRERDRLAAEYEAIMQRNEILTNNVETLQSNAGVEDLAHSSFGLVKEGENAASVSGVDIKDKSTFTAKIIPGSVPAPDTWYSDTLDWLFGYSAD